MELKTPVAFLMAAAASDDASAELQRRAGKNAQ